MDGMSTDEEMLSRFAQLTSQNHPTIVALTQQIDNQLGTSSRVSIKSDASIRNKAHRPSIVREFPWFGMQVTQTTFHIVSLTLTNY
jgi:hypothetical protein